jgi:hypothetical protein
VSLCTCTIACQTVASLEAEGVDVEDIVCRMEMVVLPDETHDHDPAEPCWAGCPAQR